MRQPCQLPPALLTAVLAQALQQLLLLVPVPCWCLLLHCWRLQVQQQLLLQELLHCRCC
jgi:hypothetical protein